VLVFSRIILPTRFSDTLPIEQFTCSDLYNTLCIMIYFEKIVIRNRDNSHHKYLDT